MKSALTDTAPIKASELETKPGWIIATMVGVGLEIAAIPTGVCAVIYWVGTQQ